MPSGRVDVPKGAVLRLRVELEEPCGTDSLARLPACGLWADRTDLGNTPSAARLVRRRVEKREDRRR